MANTPAIRKQPVVLSPGQQKEHQIPGGHIECEMLEGLGDGWVLNTPENEHLDGVNVQTSYRYGKISHPLVPISNVLLQGERIDWQLSDETNRLVGYFMPDGTHIEGTLGKVRGAHARLAYWMDLLPEDKDDIASVYGDAADERALAYNVFNLLAGSIAQRCRTLEDSLGRKNPGVVRNRTLDLEQQFLKRHDQLVKHLSANEQRSSRFRHEWVFRENQVLSDCYAILERLLADPNTDNMADLKYRASLLRFSHMPFNKMAFDISQNGGQVGEEIVLNALAAIQFRRYTNYMLSPFRRITASPRKRPTIPRLAEDEPIGVAMERRLEALNSMQATGTLGQLVGRVAGHAETALGAVRSGEKTLARKAANAAKWLLNYHCFPVNDPAKEVWHGHKLH